MENQPEYSIPVTQDLIDPFRALFNTLQSVFKVQGANLRTENRTYISLPIYYKVAFREPWVKTRTINISENGICCVVNQPLKPGQEIEIEVPKKSFKTQEIMRVKGFVAWVKPLDTEGQFKCGIKFNEKQVTFRRENSLLVTIADYNCSLMERLTRGFNGFPVNSIAEIKSAFNLVYVEYRKRQLCDENFYELHYNFYSLLPNSRTFVLKDKDKLLGTISLFPDSMSGLPMETIFQQEIGELRLQGRKMAEVGLLALNSIHFHQKQYSFMNLNKQAALFKLYKTLFDYLKQTEITDLIIGVHPKHVFLYQYLNFQVYGPVRSYKGACDKPAVLMRFDVGAVMRNQALLKEGPGKYFLQGIMLKEILLRRVRWTNEVLVDFLCKIKPIWRSLTNEQRYHLNRVYPLINDYIKCLDYKKS